MYKLGSTLVALLLAAGIAPAQAAANAVGPNDISDAQNRSMQGNTAEVPRSSGASNSVRNCPDESMDEAGNQTSADGSQRGCVDSSGDSGTITTDSQPIGSTVPEDNPQGPSEYPVSPGSGSAGSGSTRPPTGPAPGPTLGIGR